MRTTIAGIDVHKKVLMVVVVSQQAGETQVEARKRFGSTTSELSQLRQWLSQQGVQEAVMESTALYWRPVWMELEGSMKLHLAQAFSNRARRGRKNDFKDAERLVKRLLAEELILSFVPDQEQRGWRTMTRIKVQLARDRVRLHNQVEGLLEEMRIKLSSVVSDLFGVSGLRILRALAAGETDGEKLAALGSLLRCGKEQLMDALDARPSQIHRQLLGLYLERLQVLDTQMEQVNQMIATAMKPHEDAVMRLAEVPGFGADSAQQVIAEVGPEASTFASSAEFTSWAGTCPGKQESAEKNASGRSAKGNKYLRRVLTEVAQAAVKAKGSHWQTIFQRLLPRLGYRQALWAVVHRLCRLVWKILHDGVRYIEQGQQRDPKAVQRRAKALARALRNLGYNVNLQPREPYAVSG